MQHWGHFIFWGLFVSYKIIFENIRVTQISDSIDTVFIYSIYIANFYYIIYLLSKYFGKNKIKFATLLIVGYFFYIAFLHFYCKILIQSIGHGLYYRHLSITDTVLDGTDIYVQFSFYAIGFWFFSLKNKTQTRLFIKENEILKLRNENLELEHKKIELEYSYLKSQINPHFLYNTLGCFHGEAARYSDQLANGIANLSNIMRYALHNAEGLKNVPIASEIEFLNQYLELQQMRHKNKLPITCAIDIVQCATLKVPPFTFISLVENAFKHGSFQQAPLVINIICTGCKLTFTVINKIGCKTDEVPGGGIGLKQIADVLILAYGPRQRLTYGAIGNGYYEAVLIIEPGISGAIADINN